MKLLLCLSCQDVIRLPINLKERSCQCGKVKGRYLNHLHAEYSGESAYPIGFDNHTLAAAISTQPQSGKGKEFTAFIIPKECPTFKKV
jgi:hypothetical protein